MMPIELQRNSFIIQFNFLRIPNGGLQFQRGGVGERWRDCEGGREGVTDAR